MNENFAKRHLGPSEAEVKSMLELIGTDSLDKLIDETIPQEIRLQNELNLPPAKDEYTFLQEFRQLAQKNQLFKSYIGLGYYDCITPPVILRNVLENPGWYTSYTPYQAEISQGRLEALLNFQTMVTELTGMEIAGASLLDEATAAAEAMTMFYRLSKKKDCNRFFVSENCFPQTIAVLQTRARPLNIELVIGKEADMQPETGFFGALIQYPDKNGSVNNYQSFVTECHNHGVMVAFAADLLSLTLLKAPSELGADAVLGSSQRFGVPLGYGGPHAAYFATQEKYQRQLPGRIIGVSKDRYGNPAYRMALQVREQHIRRDKATSNICTAQALLAVMAGMYAVYHGPDGLKNIAGSIHQNAVILENSLNELGYEQINNHYFDTLKIKAATPAEFEQIRETALATRINFYYEAEQYILISLDETTSQEDMQQIINIFGKVKNINNIKPAFNQIYESKVPVELMRQKSFLNQEVFHKYHSETQMLRYLKKLENKDISLTNSMIPLGSCTMKLNATTEMLPVSWPEFSRLHPFVPIEQAQGYQLLFQELEKYLCEITGFAAVSFQPNSGAQGEFAGLMVIRAWHEDRGDTKRNVVIIPASAHGTNPASASMAGMKVVVVNCDEQGNIDFNDLQNKAAQYSKELAALMVTYPSTHGVFEESIKAICDLIHQHGGLIYMDGANMNAQVGFTNPAVIGADVCHLNLHKTFSIPHGGGGPGMGPIGVTEELKPYLPSHPLVSNSEEKAIKALAAAPWGSASILPISYAYIKLLGKTGLGKVSQYAILNANYLKARLENKYKILFLGKQGRVAHELIIDLHKYKKELKISVEDVAKRLMDYGFHAPTMSWPVHDTFMIEPTESESKEELDRFCEAMEAIYEEIEEIARGEADPLDNVLKNAPHTAVEIASDNWSHPYSREKAAYPVPYLKENKFWLSVGRIDNAYGDRHLVCTCPPLESYTESK